MAEYYAFQAALCFSAAHLLVRRGLVGSNALSGSVISLGTSAVIFWSLVIFFVPVLKFNRRSSAWLFGGALVNTGAYYHFSPRSKSGKSSTSNPWLYAIRC